MCKRQKDQLNESQGFELINSSGYYTVFQISFDFDKSHIYVGRRCAPWERLVPVSNEQRHENYNFILDPWTSSQSTWGIIQSWIQNCLGQHENCNQRGQSSYIPTRVLTITTDEQGIPTYFRLILGEDCPNKARYITLSHCWGPQGIPEEFQLRRASYQQLKSGQSVQSLPKTFQDAIAVTAKLGIQYIWIDSLCIQQDSNDDWETEASYMQDVYRYGALNISALGSPNSEGGLFYKRNPGDVAPAIVQLKRAIASIPELFRLKIDDSSWKNDFESDPIIRRGWVVQERVLSPRVLHFGQRQVFWECQQQSACEAHPQTIPEMGVVYRPAANQKHKPTFLSDWKILIEHSDKSHEHREIYMDPFRQWRRMVELYSKCNLTRPEDKLIAISGLATDMKRILKSLDPGCPHNYLAGLWEERLGEDLSWSLRNPGKRPELERAPSWSWASVDGEVIWWSWAFSEIMKIVHCSARTLIGNGGQITASRISLRGHWMILHLVFPFDRVSNGMEPTLSNPTATIESGSFLHPLPAQISIFLDAIDDTYDVVFGMPILRTETEGSSFQALLLVNVGGNDNNTYRRIGIGEFVCRSRESSISLLKSFPKKHIDIQ
ncbi:heterokaryon incompatibility protein-domain-containing protein [Dendryphion nanum]|uniref:Heterokaryon incompatibility protein-domain-containing protein n=1 Tax=Dendryphion nanum TaxID=256645 RepID=A0A9P9IZJ8_9PLEO|nr:heterokaryon incompatibility protein-domain-containing protein [Dendryphion nanum]